MEQIYLEPDEEITSVIEKVSGASSGKVAVVVPKNGTLFQSLVNLKLLAKQAKESNKEVVLVTGNKVGQRLAAQVGIEAYATLGTVKAPAEKSPTPKPLPTPTPEEKLPDGTPIHHYTPAVGGAVSQKPEEGPSEPVVTPEVVPAEEETKPVTSPAEDLAPPEKPTPVAAPPSPPDELPAIVSRTPIQKPEFHFHLPWKSLLAAAGLLLIAFFVTYILLPKATVVVTLPAKAVSETLLLNARTVSDGAATTVAGNLLTVEKSLTKSVAATGKKDIGTSATGTIAFRNCEDSSTHTVAAGSKVTASGKTFTTNATATIPAGSFSGGGSVCNSSSVNIGLTASEAGESYNVKNATFTINGLSSRISGSGSTSGGTTKQVTVLTQEDLDKALSELEKQATDEATTELRTKAEKQTLLEGSLISTVKERTADKKAGDQVESATARLNTTLSAIVFDASEAETKLRDSLSQKLETGQRLEIPEDQSPTMSFKNYSDDKTVMTFEIVGSGYGVPDVSKAELARMIRHASHGQVEAKLKETYQASEVTITSTPSWWFDRMPLLSQAITVEYGFSEQAESAEEAPVTE